MWCSCGFVLLEPDLRVFYSEPHDVEFDGGATFLCTLSADVDGEFKSELQGAGERGHSSLRCWSEKTEQFHDPETKGELHGRRRRGGRKISSSLCSTSAPRGRSSLCSARALDVAEARSGSDSSVSHSFVAYDSSFSVRVESPGVQRVNAALHGADIAGDTQNSYSVHDACVVLNSSLREGVVPGRGVCVL